MSIGARPAPHVALVALTSQSHVYPSLALVRELVDRGVRLTVAVGESQRDLLEPTGADVVTHPSVLPGEAGASSHVPRDAGEVMQIFLDEGRGSLPRLIDRFDADPPDLVLHDPGAMAAPLLAHRYGVAAVPLPIMPMVWPDEPDDGVELSAALANMVSARRYYAEADAWVAEHGVEGGAAQLQTHPVATLSLVPRLMQPGAERAPGSVRFVGPCLDPGRLADRSWTPPADGRPVVLVSLGNSFNDQPDFHRTCVEAFAATDRHAVVVAGRHAGSPQLGPLPPNVEVHARVPQLTVLAHAEAFVTHAGMGGCVEAIWRAVPTVSIPQGVDQFGNAVRMAELGLGCHLPAEDVTAETLRAAVDDVVADPVIADTVRAAQGQIMREGGTVIAADAVQELLRSTRSR